MLLIISSRLMFDNYYCDNGEFMAGGDIGYLIGFNSVN